MKVRAPKKWFTTITDYVNFNYVADSNVVTSSIAKVNPAYTDRVTILVNKPNYCKFEISEGNVDSLNKHFIDGSVADNASIAVFTFDSQEDLQNYLPKIARGNYLWDNIIDKYGNVLVDAYSYCNNRRNIEVIGNSIVKYSSNVKNEDFYNVVSGERIRTYELDSGNWIPHITIEMKTIRYPNSIYFDSSREEIVRIFRDILQPISSTKTLTLGATLLAKLTDEDKKIATDKGWTLA